MWPEYSFSDLRNLIHQGERGSHLEAREPPVDTSTAAGKCFFDLLSAFLERPTCERSASLRVSPRPTASASATGRPDLDRRSHAGREAPLSDRPPDLEAGESVAALALEHDESAGEIARLRLEGILVAGLEGADREDGRQTGDRLRLTALIVDWSRTLRLNCRAPSQFVEARLVFRAAECRRTHPGLRVGRSR
jgi:hypothetical protein